MIGQELGRALTLRGDEVVIGKRIARTRKTCAVHKVVEAKIKQWFASARMCPI